MAMSDNESRVVVVFMVFVFILALMLMALTCGTPERMCISETSEERQQQCMEMLLKLKEASDGVD
jgi:ABC-type Na+ efflux pump permease subunit